MPQSFVAGIGIAVRRAGRARRERRTGRASKTRNVNLQLLPYAAPSVAAIPRGPPPDRATKAGLAVARVVSTATTSENADPGRDLAAEYVRSKIIFNMLPLGLGENHNKDPRSLACIPLAAVR